MTGTTYRGGASRRAILAGGAGLLAAPGLAPGMARAQGAWPTARPITLVVAYPPGGQTDFAARIAQPGMGTALGQGLVIDNRAGAGGNIGTDYVMRARPDGYTLIAANSAAQTINPHTFPSMSFDPRQLTPIGLLLQSALVLCVHPSLPIRNVAEFTAWVKAQQGGANYATSSVGSLTHVTMELFRARIGNPAMEAVTYRGSGPMIQDLIAGRLPAAFDASSVLAVYIKSGQLDASRNPALREG